MAVDLSSIESKLKQEVDVQVDFDAYVDASEFPPPIPEGVYTLKQGKPKFEASKEGYLVAVFEKHVVEGGEQDGKSVAFDRISNKTFERQGVRVSMMGDQLRALGDTSRPRTNQEYADVIEANEGRPFKAQVQWEGFCGHKDTPVEVADAKDGVTLKGANQFPSAPSGERIPEVKCPKDGCGKTIRARARINRRIAAGTN